MSCPWARNEEQENQEEAEEIELDDEQLAESEVEKVIKATIIHFQPFSPICFGVCGSYIR